MAKSTLKSYVTYVKKNHEVRANSILNPTPIEHRAIDNPWAAPRRLLASNRTTQAQIDASFAKAKAASRETVMSHQYRGLDEILMAKYIN